MNDHPALAQQGTQAHKKFFLQQQQLRKRRTTSAKDEAHLTVISFALFGEVYGLELETLQEVLKVGSITRVPQSPEYLRGIINLRGNLITVIDLKKRFGAPIAEVTRDSRIMIVRHEQRSVGLLVDQVLEILQLEKQSIVPPPAHLPESKRQLIKGLGEKQDKVIILLALKHLFNH